MENKNTEECRVTNTRFDLEPITEEAKQLFDQHKGVLFVEQDNRIRKTHAENVLIFAGHTPEGRVLRHELRLRTHYSTDHEAHLIVGNWERYNSMGINDSSERWAEQQKGAFFDQLKELIETKTQQKKHEDFSKIQEEYS